MQFTRLITAELLLAVGGALIFFSFGTWSVLSALMHVQYENTSLPSELQNASYFDIGQYYFNHDDDPGGPYDIAKAREYFELEIAQYPQRNKLVYYQLGRIDFIQGDFEAALNNFTKQIEYFDDAVPNVYYMIGLTYGYRARVNNDPEDWHRAEEAFAHFIEFAPEAPWSRVDLSWIYFSQGKYEAMLPILEQGLTYKPDNPWLLNMYGLALLNTGKIQEAQSTFLRAKEQSALLTVDDWGRAYPGNNPDAWAQGLSEFRAIIDKNIELSSK